MSERRERSKHFSIAGLARFGSGISLTNLKSEWLPVCYITRCIKSQIDLSLGPRIPFWSTQACRKSWSGRRWIRFGFDFD